MESPTRQMGLPWVVRMIVNPMRGGMEFVGRSFERGQRRWNISGIYIPPSCWPYLGSMACVNINAALAPRPLVMCPCWPPKYQAARGAARCGAGSARWDFAAGRPRVWPAPRLPHAAFHSPPPPAPLLWCIPGVVVWMRMQDPGFARKLFSH